MMVLRRILCQLLGHRPHPSVNKRWSIMFQCTRCHLVVPGDAANDNHY